MERMRFAQTWLYFQACTLQKVVRLCTFTDGLSDLDIQSVIRPYSITPSRSD